MPASGGPWGGTSVDNAFIQFIIDLFGKDMIRDFKRDNMEDYLQLLKDFEIKKRSPVSKNIHLGVPLALMTMLTTLFDTKDKKACMKKVLEKSTLPYKDKLSYANYKLKLPAEVFQGLFKPTVSKIVEHMKSLYIENSLYDVNTILLVGGFSESKIVQAAVGDVFGPESKDQNLSGRRIIVPEESGLAVLKGAVYFGHIPNAISRRVSRFTYGIQSYPEFNPAKHPADKKVIIGGVERCKDVFFPYVKKGEHIKPGLKHSQVFQALKPDQRKLECVIFISDKENPEYITETCCKKLGVLTIDLPAGQDGELVEFEEAMVFGETELQVKARDIYRNVEKEIKFDLLDEANLIRQLRI